MKYPMTKLCFTLWLSIFSMTAVFAADLSSELNAIKGLQHPSENIYAAGQPPADSFAALAKAGIRHVINLRPPEETPGFNEAAIATQSNLAYYNIPVSGATDLTRDKVKLLDDVLSKIGNEKVILHCSSGNRAGALMALRAAWIDGASAEQAIQVGERHGLTKLRPKVESLLTEQ